ncbi:MAG: ribonuclease Z [Crocinitomicaceae bacterium]
MNFSVTILGSGAALPTKNRMPTSQYVNCNNRHFLIDCAEGTQLQLRKYKINFQKISHIFISHLHGDHYFGLVGLLSTMNLLGREKELFIHGPKELQELILPMLHFGGARLAFKLNFTDLNTTDKTKIYEDSVLEVHSFPLVHKIPTCGFIIKEKKKALKINPAKIKEKNLKIVHFKALQNGQDIKLENGEEISFKDVTFPPTEVLSYAYCSDTKKNLKVVEFIKEATVLYHEATFLIKDQNRANSTYHSSTKDAALIASKAKVKKLLVGHISSRYKTNDAHTLELKDLFSNSQVAEDGLCIDLTKEQSMP